MVNTKQTVRHVKRNPQKHIVVFFGFPLLCLIGLVLLSGSNELFPQRQVGLGGVALGVQATTCHSKSGPPSTMVYLAFGLNKTAVPVDKLLMPAYRGTTPTLCLDQYHFTDSAAATGLSMADALQQIGWPSAPEMIEPAYRNQIVFPQSLQTIDPSTYNQQAQQAQDARQSDTINQWMINGSKALARAILTAIGGFLGTVLNWMNSWGFIFSTPADLTYGHSVVIGLNHWSLMVANAAMVLILVMGGYNYILGRSTSFREFLPRLVLMGIMANASLFLLQQFIDLHNTICGDLISTLNSLGHGVTKFPWGQVDYSKNSLTSIVAYLIEVIGALVLSLQMLMRIALLDLLLILAPAGLLCFVLPQTESLGRLWLQTLGSTVIIQLLQDLCLGMGGALAGSIPKNGFNQIDVFVGVATIFLALQLPGMLSWEIGQALGRANVIPGIILRGKRSGGHGGNGDASAGEELAEA